VQQVVENKVAAHRTRRVYILHLGREELTDVAELEDEEDDPVDGDDDRVQAKARRMGIVLVPDGPMGVASIVGSMEIVVNGRDDREKPGEDSEHLVRDHRVLAVRIPLRKGVDCARRNGVRC